jgi:hypothetical protein
MEAGKLVKTCLEKGAFQLAEKLIAAGYTLPDDIIIEMIREKKWEVLQAVLNQSYQTRLQDTVVEFWYLLKEN